MRLKILLPFKVFADKSDVLRIVAESRSGAFGLLPTVWTALWRWRRAS